MKNNQYSKTGLQKRIMYFLRYSIMLVMLGVIMPAHSVVFDPVFGTQVDDLQVPINQSRILVFDDVINANSRA